VSCCGAFLLVARSFGRSGKNAKILAERRLHELYTGEGVGEPFDCKRFGLARISHTRSTATGCGPLLLRSGPNCPWAGWAHPARREPPGGKSGPRVDARGTLRATLRVVCLRLTSLCSVYLRYAPIRSGCGHGSALRLATKRYEKSGLNGFAGEAAASPGRRNWARISRGRPFFQRSCGRESHQFPVKTFNSPWKDRFFDPQKPEIRPG
jgi:hypothetical protein